MTSSIAIRLDIIDTFQLLQGLLRDLEYAITVSDQALPVWLPEQPSDSGSARIAVATHLKKLWHSNSTDGRKSERFHGALAASATTLELIQAVNETKTRFKVDLEVLRHSVPNSKGSLAGMLEEFAGRDCQVADALKHAGMTRLNLTQVYRHISVAPAKPKTIGFSWAKGKRSIKRLDRDTALRLVRERYGTEGGHGQFEERLSSIDTTVKLAIIRPIQPSLIANLAMPIEGKVVRRQLQAHSPIFYPFPVTDAPQPKINWPGSLEVQKANKSRSERSEAIPVVLEMDLYQVLS